MTDFEYDCKEKKILARSARHRVASTRGPKGCSLPCDNLTDAQRNALNGEVHTYNLSRPMTWAEINALPEDLQRQYLAALLTIHGGSVNSIAHMAHTANPNVKKLCEKHGLAYLLNPSHCGRKSNADREAWANFLNPPTQPAAPETTAQTGELTPKAPPVVLSEPTAMIPKDWSVTLHGKLRIADIANALLQAPSTDRPVTVHIKWTVDEQKEEYTQ